MQDYDFKARFESLPDSTTRLDTRGLLTTTPRVLTFRLPAAAQEKMDTRSLKLIRFRIHL
jgi:hypothetical protein